ncbi:MAG TPA: transposase [Vicinamibacterales bacterium]|nr:transposase [Vicinamibacterales bacterium]
MGRGGDGPNARFSRRWIARARNIGRDTWGADEIQRGKGQRFWTLLSDLVRGEVIGLEKERTEDTLRRLLTTLMDAHQRAAAEAVCTDMHRPYINAVGEVLGHAEIVFDKFTYCNTRRPRSTTFRRQGFFRAGAVMRPHGRGKRWLLLRRWATVRGSKRRELETLLPPIAGCSKPTSCWSHSPTPPTARRP